MKLGILAIFLMAASLTLAVTVNTKLGKIEGFLSKYVVLLFLNTLFEC